MSSQSALSELTTTERDKQKHRHHNSASSSQDIQYCFKQERARFGSEGCFRDASVVTEFKPSRLAVSSRDETRPVACGYLIPGNHMVAAIPSETSKHISPGQDGGRHLEECQVARLLAVGTKAADESEGSCGGLGNCNACDP